jgi:hypothetical protein
MSEEHVVEQGECLSSIASRYGLPWRRIWSHPNNAKLRKERQNPNVLFPGDLLFIPDMEVREESGATEMRHRFLKKGVPVKLQIRLLDLEEKPRGGVEYLLEIDGAIREGSTDAEGWIRQSIPPEARKGRLVVRDGSESEEYELNLGHLDPPNTDAGVRQRLDNLGFDCGGDADAKGPGVQAAIRAFQRKHGLKETGVADDATRSKLEEAHGS